MVIWVGTVNRDARVVSDLGAAAGQVELLTVVVRAVQHRDRVLLRMMSIFRAGINTHHEQIAVCIWTFRTILKEWRFNICARVRQL